MSVLQPHTPLPSEEREASRQTLVVIFILSGIVVVAGMGYGIYRWTEWVGSNIADFQIDQSQATFRASLQGSVYENPKYGMTLRLPSRWDQGRPVPSQYCALENAAGLSATLTGFPKVGPQALLSTAEALERMQAPNSQYRKTRETQFVAHGKESMLRLYEAGQPGPGNKSAILLVAGESKVFVLVITGGHETAEGWKMIVDALPDALEVR